MCDYSPQPAVWWYSRIEEQQATNKQYTVENATQIAYSEKMHCKYPTAQ